MLGGTIDGQALQFFVRHVLEGLDKLLPYRLRGLVRRWRCVDPIAAVWLPVDGVLTHVSFQLFQRFVQQGRNRFPCLARERFEQVFLCRCQLKGRCFHTKDHSKKTKGLQDVVRRTTEPEHTLRAPQTSGVGALRWASPPGGEAAPKLLEPEQTDTPMSLH